MKVPFRKSEPPQQPQQIPLPDQLSNFATHSRLRADRADRLKALLEIAEVKEAIQIYQEFLPPVPMRQG